jgi:UDP-sulfoquinovose synthase
MTLSLTNTQLIKREKPDTVVHFAEQRAAPYSMKNPRTKRYTIDNNLPGTHNLLCAIVESEVDVHVVHLGTVKYISSLLV